MLQFVHTTVDSSNIDQHARKQIRSHAMKDFRKRQRCERRKAAEAAIRSSAKASSIGEPFYREDSHDDDDQGLDRRKAKMTDQISVDRQGQSHSMLVFPSTWGKETPDIFQSPAQLKMMFGLCRAWFEWLRPDIKAYSAGKPIEHAWSICPSPMLLAANCLAAVSGLDAADSTRSSGLETLFKARVLREVKLRMTSTAAASTDETMTAILFLATYEHYRVNPETITHLKGLRSILRMKGEVGPGMKWGGGVVLELLDLLTALWSKSEPLMVSLDRPSPPRDDQLGEEANLQPEQANVGSALSRIIEVLTPELKEFSQEDCNSDTTMLSDFLSILNTAKDRLTYSPDSTDDSTDEFFDQLTTFSSTHCTCAPDQEPTNSTHLSRTFHQTLAILYNVIANHQPFDHPTNTTYLRGIITNLNAISNQDIWTGRLYLKYFALLTGAAAARNSSDKSFCHSLIGKNNMMLGLVKWPKSKEFIINFLRLKRDLEPKRKRERGKHDKILLSSRQNPPVLDVGKGEQAVPVDHLIRYGMLTSQGQGQTGLDKLLADDRTFHNAMLSGTFWKTE